MIWRFDDVVTKPFSLPNVIGLRSFEPVVFGAVLTQNFGVLGCFGGLEWPKLSNKPTFTIKTFAIGGTKVALFWPFGPCLLLKQPKEP